MANSAIVGLLRVLLGLNTAEFDTNVDKAKSKAKGLGGEFLSFGKSFATAFLPAASAAGAGLALAAFAKQTFAAADALVALSGKTGIGIVGLQKMEFVAGQTGIELNDLTNAAFKLGVNIEKGTKDAGKALEFLGMSFASIRDLRPEAQFDLIVKALEGVEDATKRNELGVALFGRGFASIAPAIAAGYTKIKDDAHAAGEANVKAAERAGDAWAAFTHQLSTAGIQVFGGMARAFQTLGTGIDDLTDQERAHLAFLKKSGGDWQSYLDEITQKHIDLRLEQGAQTLATERQNRITRELTKSGLPDYLAEADSIGRKLTDTAEELAKKYEIVQNKTDDWNTSIISINRSGFAMLEWLVPLTPALHDAGQELQNIGAGLTGEGFLRSEEIEETGRATAEATEETLAWARAHGAVLAPSIEQSTSEIEEATSKTRQWGETLGDVLLRIPGLLQNAFTGGGGAGGFGKALASMFGQAGIGRLFEKDGLIGKQLSGLGKLFGDTFVFGLGQALGSLLPLAFSGLKKLFGIGINNEVKKANREIDILKDGLLDTYGTLDDLERAANAVGLSFKANWGHQGLAGLKAFQDLVDEFQGKLSDTQEDLNDQLADTNQELDGLIAKGRELGYVFDREGNLIEVRFENMQSVAEQFGIDISSLGSKFQGQRLAADAKGIVDAFTLLEKGGTSVGTILLGLKEEIGHLVSESIKFGTKIPENMRPWIKNLIDTGQLIDDDGQKITDMAAINFGPPIEAEFDIIQRAIRESVQAINDLIAKINDLINAIMGIPDRTVTITEKIVTDDQRDPNDPIGPSPDENVPMAAAGGFVRRSGAALIHSGELIGPVRFMAQALRGAMALQSSTSMSGMSGLSPALAGASGGSVGGHTTTIINNHFEFNTSTLDTDEMSRMIRRRVMPEINSQLSNVGELRSANRDALGI